MGFLVRTLPHKVSIFMLLSIAGCSANRMNITLERTPFDQPMYGRVPERTFADTSQFTFPLAVAWSYESGAGFGHAPMVVGGSTLFVGTLRGEMQAVDLGSGKRIGNIKTYSPVYAAPALFNKLLIFCTESGKENLVAFHIPESEIVWTKDLGGIAASPLVYRERLIAAGLNGTVVAIDSNGIDVWKYSARGEIRSSPAAAGNSVYCATTKGEIFALNAEDGSLRWKASTRNAVFAGLSVVDGYVVAASRDSSVSLFDAENGTLARRFNVGNKIMASPSAKNGMLYIPTLEGSLFAFDIASGELRWRFNAKSVINTTPIVVSNAIFVASLDKYLYALDSESGEVLWKYELSARVKSTPIVWKNSLVIAADDKTIYSFTSTP
jgi:outer membrane protein assembly factor BamB